MPTAAWGFEVKVARALLGVVLAAPAAWGHDVSVDVSGSLITTSENNPRAGSLGVMASGGWDVSDDVSLFLTLGYTRELPTPGATSTSPSNVFLLGLGAMWLPGDSWMTMLTVTGSPSSRLRSVTTLPLPERQVRVTVDSRSWMVGGLWTLSWVQPPHEGPWSSLVDGFAGAVWYDVFQQVEVPATPPGDWVRAQCALPSAPRVCPLVNGASSPLLQVRLGGGYTGTLFDDTDLGVEVQGFLYDRDPSDVGYFSLLTVGRRLELGSGVPVLPLAVSVRPSVLHRFSKVSLKLAYQWGLYTGAQGSNHALTLRATWKVSKAWRLQGTVTGQLDATASGPGNYAGFFALGATVLF
ncbi:MAG: hypothetical protein IT380_25380 [Myxococcales bacterium]|nr:hypothetical protein [Myxococcales bacterium]